MPKKVVSLFRSNVFKIGLAVALFVAAVLIVLAMLLGNEAGQFVIRVQSGAADKSIAVCADEDYTNKEHQSSTLIVDGIDGMLDYSPAYFLEAGYTKLNEYTNVLGAQNIDNSLYIYTFYIVNTSGAGNSVGVNISLTYSNVTNHTDEIVRILTYYQSYNVSDPRVYQKADNLEKLGLSEPPVYNRYILQPVNFADSSNVNQGVVFNDQSVHIGANAGENYVKYSIFFWIEGDDPDSQFYATDQGNALYGGTIKFKLDITVDMTV